MGAPKIKMYQLPAGYSEDADSDLQTLANDELLPVADRSQLPGEAVLLTGIVPQNLVALEPVDLGSGRQTDVDLVPPSGQTQTPDGYDWDDVLHAVGYLGIRVYDGASQLIDESLWSIGDDGLVFQAPYPSGATASFYLQDSGGGYTTWALASSRIYEGANDSFNQVLVSVNYDPVALASLDVNHSYATTVPASSVRATYAYTQDESRYFCGDHNNWVSDHYQMRPDVFVGTEDYPGDASEIDGVPYEPGEIPSFVDPDAYSLNARDGLISFASAVDSAADPVRANYAYLVDVGNVTGQKLDEVVGASGLAFQADTETAYPASHGKRWVQQDHDDRPLNVYVDGVEVPGTQTVSPYDQLTVKTEA